MSVMDDKLKEKLFDACEPEMSSLNGSLNGYSELNHSLRIIIEQCIKTYQEETGSLPFESDVVFVSFPIDELKAIKESIQSAKYPRVTFNGDMELMKEERDMSRDVSLDELERWIERVLR